MSISHSAALDDITNEQKRPRLQFLEVVIDHAVARKSRSQGAPPSSQQQNIPFPSFEDFQEDEDHTIRDSPAHLPQLVKNSEVRRSISPAFEVGELKRSTLSPPSPTKFPNTSRISTLKKRDSGIFFDNYFTPGEAPPSKRSSTDDDYFDSASRIEASTRSNVPSIVVEDYSQEDMIDNDNGIDDCTITADNHEAHVQREESIKDTTTTQGWYRDFDLDLYQSQDGTHDMSLYEELELVVTDDQDMIDTSDDEEEYPYGERLATIVERSCENSSRTTPARSVADSHRGLLQGLGNSMLKGSKSFPMLKALTRKRKAWSMTQSMDDGDLKISRWRRKMSTSKSRNVSHGSRSTYGSLGEQPLEEIPEDSEERSSHEVEDLQDSQTLRPAFPPLKPSGRIRQTIHRLISASRRSEERVASQAQVLRAVSLPERLHRHTRDYSGYVSLPQEEMPNIHEVMTNSQQKENDVETNKQFATMRTLSSDQLLDALVRGCEFHSGRTTHSPPVPEHMSDEAASLPSLRRRGNRDTDITMSGVESPLTPRSGSPEGSPTVLTPSPLRVRKLGSWADPQRSSYVSDTSIGERTFSETSVYGKFPVPPAQSQIQCDWNAGTSGDHWPILSRPICTSAGADIVRPDATSLKSFDAASGALAAHSTAASNSSTSLVQGTPLNKLVNDQLSSPAGLDDPFTGGKTPPSETNTPTTRTAPFRAATPPSPTPTPSPISVPSPLQLRRAPNLNDYGLFPPAPAAITPRGPRLTSTLRSVSSMLRIPSVTIGSIRGSRGSLRGANRLEQTQQQTRIDTLLPVEFEDQPQSASASSTILTLLSSIICGMCLASSPQTSSSSPNRLRKPHPSNKLCTSPVHSTFERAWWTCAHCLGNDDCGVCERGQCMTDDARSDLRKTRSWHTMSTDLPPAREVGEDRMRRL